MGLPPRPLPAHDFSPCRVAFCDRVRHQPQRLRGSIVGHRAAADYTGARIAITGHPAGQSVLGRASELRAHGKQGRIGLVSTTCTGIRGWSEQPCSTPAKAHDYLWFQLEGIWELCGGFHAIV